MFGRIVLYVQRARIPLDSRPTIESVFIARFYAQRVDAIGAAGFRSVFAAKFGSHTSGATATAIDNNVGDCNAPRGEKSHFLKILTKIFSLSP